MRLILCLIFVFLSIFPDERYKAKVHKADPTTFDLYLVDNAVYPTVEKKVASDVETSKGSYTVSDLSGVTDGYVLSLHPVIFLIIC